MCSLHMHALPVSPARPVTLVIVILIPLLQLTCSQSSSQGWAGLALSCPGKKPEITGDFVVFQIQFLSEFKVVVLSW